MIMQKGASAQVIAIRRLCNLQQAYLNKRNIILIRLASIAMEFNKHRNAPQNLNPSYLDTP